MRPYNYKEGISYQNDSISVSPTQQQKSEAFVKQYNQILIILQAMANREKLYRPHCYNAQTLSALLKTRNHNADPELIPSHKVEHPLPKFQKANSQSRLPRATSAQQAKKSFQKQTKKIYGKLFSQLKQIKEALKESLVKGSNSKKKTSVKRREKLVTEISEPNQMIKRTDSGGKNNYYDVLKHIEEIKSRNKAIKPQKEPLQQAGQQKTLFYGLDYIDNIQFKIKIKLSRTTYLLFAKNNHTKIMVEMSYPEYMKLNQSELKGNPCNILQFLKIENNKVKLNSKLFSEKKRFQTFKCFLTYY